MLPIQCCLPYVEQTFVYILLRKVKETVAQTPQVSPHNEHVQSQPTNMASTGILAVTPVSLVSPFVSPYVPCSSSAIIVSCFLHMLL